MFPLLFVMLCYILDKISPDKNNRIVSFSIGFSVA